MSGLWEMHGSEVDTLTQLLLARFLSAELRCIVGHCKCILLRMLSGGEKKGEKLKCGNQPFESGLRLRPRLDLDL